jgi:cytochrome c-type biogenesis protein CcmH
MNAFLLAGMAMILLAAALVVAPLLRRGWRAHRVAVLLGVIAIPMGTILIYGVVSNHEWLPGTATGAGPGAMPEAGSLEAAVASLEDRLRNDPADEEGWLLLGSSYINLGRPADAVKAFERALGISNGGNMVARLNLAEAQVLLDPEALKGGAGQEIDAIISAEPRNPKALWYGGLRALAIGDAGVAKARWTTLLELSPPERIRQIIEAQLAQLDVSGPEAGTGQAAPAGSLAADAAPGNAGATLDLQVSLSPELKAQVAADAPLFVFVRDPARPGPPLAVVRRRASDLPTSLRISDADVMLPGSTLGALQQARVVARIAKGGDPVARPGDIFGEAVWNSGHKGPLSIVIDQVVAP